MSANFSNFCLGSSPHTWRIQTDFLKSARSSRIISTYVENTFIVPNNSYTLEDHLHIRGEYLSSTRIRLLIPRIISTYVENTIKTEDRYIVIQDHLHIRGEYKNHGKFIHEFMGSSPHTWRILQIT